MADTRAGRPVYWFPRRYQLSVFTLPHLHFFLMTQLGSLFCTYCKDPSHVYLHPEEQGHFLCERLRDVSKELSQSLHFSPLQAVLMSRVYNETRLLEAFENTKG